MSVDTLEQHETLVRSLMDLERWPQGGGDRRRIDTHISTVILAGAVAYKIKKPLDLGFLNFLRLEARLAACHEELRLNRRLAPDIYQAVCAITGSVEAPAIDGDGEVIDYAVRMRRFDPDAILSNLAAGLQPALIEQLAERVARFHLHADRCAECESFGSPEAVYLPMQKNFELIATIDDAPHQRLEALQRWSRQQHEQLQDLLWLRKSEGYIRECHGDLHLGNVALIGGQPVVFDAIEFNPGLRWIDTISDVAFLTMDLHHQRRPGLVFRFLDRYLQTTGDYMGLMLLRFYEVYRALVRAKIAAIRRQQELSDQERAGVDRDLAAYVALAVERMRAHQGGIVITQGVSGSGKSHVTVGLPDFLPAVRLRSDVERKRILGVEPHHDATALGAYSQEWTEKTYNRLADLARMVAAAGYVAVVDATFLRRRHRQLFSDLASSMQVPFVIIDCDAPPEVLRERILRRHEQQDNVSDASLAVLQAQLASREPLTGEEVEASIAVRPEQPLDPDALRKRLNLA